MNTCTITLKISRGNYMIKPIEKKDIPQCVKVIKTSFLTVANEMGFNQQNAPRFTAFSVNAERLINQFNELRPMYGYFQNNQIVGYYSLQIIDTKCELNNLCVLPEFRHQKIGQELFFHAVNTAIERGCTIMEIGIVEENTTLNQWYQKLGAVHVSTKKFDFFPFTCGYLTYNLQL